MPQLHLIPPCPNALEPVDIHQSQPTRWSTHPDRHDLPTIFLFDNTVGDGDWHEGCAVAEDDGTCVAQHISSSHGFCKDDMGAPYPMDGGWVTSTMGDHKHAQYDKRYPGGYTVEWVPREALRGHVRLNAALDRAVADATPRSGFDVPAIPVTPVETAVESYDAILEAAAAHANGDTGMQAVTDAIKAYGRACAAAAKAQA